MSVLILMVDWARSKHSGDTPLYRSERNFYIGLTKVETPTLNIGSTVTEVGILDSIKKKEKPS